MGDDRGTVTSRGPVSRTSAVPVAAVLAVLLTIAVLVTAAPATASGLRLRLTAPAAEQEPLARVLVRARVTDDKGRPVAGVRCTFVWSQGDVVLHRSRVATESSGRARDARAVVRAASGRRVRVGVRCRRGGSVASGSVSFVPLPPLPAAPRIVFVGDSLTVGLYASTQATCFRSLLGAAAPCSTTVTASTGGRSSDVDLGSVAAAAGDIYVVELGTNDATGYAGREPVAPSRFAANLRAVARAARSASPYCRLVFLTVWQPPRVRAAYDSSIAAVGAETGRHLVDLGAFKDDPSCSEPAGVATDWGPSDGWHPNDSGHAAIASRLTSVVRRLLRLSGVPVE